MPLPAPTAAAFCTKPGIDIHASMTYMIVSMGLGRGMFAHQSCYCFLLLTTTATPATTIVLRSSRFQDYAISRLTYGFDMDSRTSEFMFLL